MIGFSEDSFFTLGLLERFGLLALSLFLSVMCVVVVRRLPLSLWLRLIAVPIILYLFIWLSPQIYYQYYIVIFDGLPWQIVVQNPPAISDFLSIIFFVQVETLAKLSQAVLFWAMILAAIARRKPSA